MRSALGDRSDRPIDETQVQFAEFGVEYQCAGDIGRERRHEFIARRRIEDLRNQFPHRSPVAAKRVVHLRENEAGNENRGGGNQNFLEFRETGIAFRRPGERPQQPSCVGNYRRDRSSRSRKGSDSSPSFVFVDSNRSVEGGRRPE